MSPTPTTAPSTPRTTAVVFESLAGAGAGAAGNVTIN